MWHSARMPHSTCTLRIIVVYHTLDDSNPFHISPHRVHYTPCCYGKAASLSVDNTPTGCNSNGSLTVLELFSKITSLSFNLPQSTPPPISPTHSALPSPLLLSLPSPSLFSPLTLHVSFSPFLLRYSYSLLSFFLPLLLTFFQPLPPPYMPLTHRGKVALIPMLRA